MYSSVVTLITVLGIIFSVNHFCLYANSQSIPYTVEVWSVPISNSSQDSVKNEFQDESSNCTKALDDFIAEVMNLNRCTLLNASPIRICTRCEKEINSTEEAYTNLQQESSCHKLYFESDQIGIISVVYGYGKNLWAASNCQNCYDHREDTQEFFEISENLDTCMKHFNETSGLNNTCSMCEDLVKKMSDIYKTFVRRLPSGESAGVCMDIVDQMNITRNIWSKMECYKFDSSIGIPNIITAAIVAIIPVLFYLLSKNVSIIEDVKLVRPKRKSYNSLHDSMPTL